MTLPRVQTRSLPGSDPEPSRPAVHVVTFGCQMNKYDSLLVEGRFVVHGYRLAGRMEEADVVLFNTCSVRDHAEERVYSWLGELRRAKERRPELVIGVMGCLAQRVEGEVFDRAPHVDIVCGTRQIQHLPILVEEVKARRAAGTVLSAGERLLEIDMQAEVGVDREGEPYTGGMVGFLAVMRGCDLSCTFCVVPTVRGGVQSRPVEALVREARWMVAGGARVIVLLGQTVNSYGEDLPKPGPGERRMRGRQGRPSLADLLHALSEVDGLERIRLVTLHPSYVTPALARAIRDCEKVDRFVPLPAQSGSDEVLRRMKRGYTTDLYRRRVDILRNEVQDIELGSDWIVGFPGETARDFGRTLELVAEIGFAQGYVFQYSPRPGTKAFELPDDVPPEVKKDRNQRLLRAVEEVALRRMERWIGREIEVVIEKRAPRRKGWLKGRSRHNLPVGLAGPAGYVGRTVRVRIGEASAFGLTGSVVE